VILQKMQNGLILFDYYNQAIERVKRHLSQPRLFESESNTAEQMVIGF
jgi:hypothetical protein